MHRPKLGRIPARSPVTAETLPATYAPHQRKRANAKIAALVGIVRSPTSHITSTRPLTNPSQHDRTKVLAPHRRPQGLRCLRVRSKDAGRRPQLHAIKPADHPAKAQARKARHKPFIDPTYKDAGRRSSILEPWISSTLPPSNKNTSPVKGSCNKKKETPLQRLCAKCHAICDLLTETRLLFIIFNSSQTGTPSKHR